MKYLCVRVILLSALFASSAATAGDKDAEATVSFDNAVKLFRQERYEEAADEFRRANSLKPSQALLYNIGQSEAAAKRYGLAYDAFEEYLSLGGDEITEQRRNQVITEMDRLSKMIGSVEIIAPRSTTVLVDDMVRGNAPLPGRIKLAVGVIHKIEVKKGDETIYTNNVKVSFG
jgi:tetratricopeptide (TPR) repeat protein